MSELDPNVRALVKALGELVEALGGNGTSQALLSEKLTALTITVTKVVDDHEERLRAVEKAAAAMTTWNIVQAAYTTIGSTIAGILGTRLPGP